MTDAAEALRYVRANLEEFKPPTAKLLLGALRKKSEVTKRALIESELRVKVLEGALSQLGEHAARLERVRSSEFREVPVEDLRQLVALIAATLPAPVVSTYAQDRLRTAMQELEQLIHRR